MHTQDLDDFGGNVESLGMAVILRLIDVLLFRLKPPMEICLEVDGNCARGRSLTITFNRFLSRG